MVARTDSPTCGAKVTVEIVAGIPNGGDAMLWLPRPPAANLLAEFCSSADLFCNADHLHDLILRLASQAASVTWRPRQPWAAQHGPTSSTLSTRPCNRHPYVNPP